MGMPVVAGDRKGIVIEEMKVVAAQEGVTEEFIRRRVPEG
jgi:phosphomethylpyrimidine synthase